MCKRLVVEHSRLRPSMRYTNYVKKTSFPMNYNVLYRTQTSKNKCHMKTNNPIKDKIKQSLDYVAYHLSIFLNI